MNFGTTAPNYDAARWHLIFTLLSLDRVRPFWNQMGLDLSEVFIIQEVARSFVNEYRQIEGQIDLSTEERVTQHKSLIDKTFDSLRKELGEKGSKKLFDWGQINFPYESKSDADAFMWRRLLRRLAGLSALSYPLVPLAFPSDLQESIKAAILRHLGDPEVLHNHLRSVEETPASAWDASIYANYTPQASPLDWVENTIEYANTRKTWQEIEKILPEDKVEIFQEWAKKQAEVMEMPVDLISLPNFLKPEDEEGRE
jgi:hypothetical protein